jgi:hypothetical protein
MRIAMMIPVFLTFMSMISRFFFDAEERGRLAVSFILLGLVGVLSFVIYSAYHAVDGRGFVQVNRDQSALRELLRQVERLPNAVARLMQDVLGPQGMFLGIVLASVLLGLGVILYLMHRSAANPD